MNLSKVIKEVLNVEESQYNDETRLSSFGEWDSMAHMFLITKIEETYEIELTGDEIANISSIGDIKLLIQSRGKTI